MVRNILIISLILASLLAGCISGDDPEPADDDGTNASSAEGFGTVRGTVVTVNLEPVEDARVQIVKETDMIAEGTTGSDGSYRITDVEPGDYRLQITAPCCREHAQGISVVADETSDVSVQLEVFSSDDLQIAHSEKFDWTGFLACTVRFINPDGPHHDHNVLGVPGGVSGVNVCSLAGDPSGDDDFLHPFEVREGVKSIVGGMVWDSPGASMGENLALLMEVNGNWNQPPRYVDADDSSPIEFRVDAGFVEEEYDDEEIYQYDFDNIEGTQDLAYRIFAGGDVEVVYQQQFTVYWDVYYWEEAPEGATALPDA